MDEKAFTFSQLCFAISGSNQAVTLGKQNRLPFFMPVPGYITDPEIVFVTGNGKGNSAMFQQLPSVTANGCITFLQTHMLHLYDGFIIEKWRF